MNAEQAMETILQNVDAGSRPAFPLNPRQEKALLKVLQALEDKCQEVKTRGGFACRIRKIRMSYEASRTIHVMVETETTHPVMGDYIGQVYSFSVGPHGGLTTHDAARKYDTHGAGAVLRHGVSSVRPAIPARTIPCRKCGRGVQELHWVDKDDFLTAVKDRRSRKICRDCVRG